MRISDWSSDVCSSDLLEMWATSASGGDLDQLRQGEDLAALRHAAEAVAADRDPGARHDARELLRDQHADTEPLGPGVHARGPLGAIGSESCRERECQSVYIWVVTVPGIKTTTR